MFAYRRWLVPGSGFAQIVGAIRGHTVRPEDVRLFGSDPCTVQYDLQPQLALKLDVGLARRLFYGPDQLLQILDIFSVYGDDPQVSKFMITAVDFCRKYF